MLCKPTARARLDKGFCASRCESRLLLEIKKVCRDRPTMECSVGRHRPFGPDYVLVFDQTDVRSSAAELAEGTCGGVSAQFSSLSVSDLARSSDRADAVRRRIRAPPL